MLRTRLVVVGLCSAGILLFLFLQSRGVDVEKHAACVTNLVELQRAHDGLERELLAARSTTGPSDRVELEFSRVRVDAKRLDAVDTGLQCPDYRARWRTYQSAVERASDHVARYARRCADAERGDPLAATDAVAEIDAVLAEDLVRRAGVLLEVHEQAFDARQRESEFLRLGLYVCSIVLLVRLLHNRHELEKRTRQLDEANQRLEARVEERTRSLSAANTALQIEVFERQRAELEMRRALKEAETASRAKSEFLANMSHEIRTPMTSILGYSERLLDAGVNDAEKMEAIGTMRRNGDHLLQIIDDILDISKIEAGKLALELIPASSRQIVSEVYAAMDVRAAIQGVDFQVKWLGPLPETILTDPMRLKQILLNLVGNAIKFTPRGSVELLIEFKAASNGSDPALWFAVSDTGIGIDPAGVERLFEPFSQADNSTTRRFGGTGLGLSISKHLVERLGGKIAVESELGRGSTFEFSIATGPLEGVAMVAGQDISFLSQLGEADVWRAAPLLPGARILVAEDGEDNRRLIGYMLNASQARIDVAVDGREAVERASAAMRAGTPYHMILMDMQMPVLDGYEATRELRKLGCTSTIIALTAHAMATDREKCLSAGCTDFCTKPILRSVFFAMLARYFDGGATNLIPTTDQMPRPADFDGELVALVHRFVAELGGDVDDMRAALDGGDLESLALLAHRLKGAAGSYGFPSLTTHAATLEKRARSRADKRELERDLELVVALCDAARSEHGFS